MGYKGGGHVRNTKMKIPIIIIDLVVNSYLCFSKPTCELYLLFEFLKELNRSLLIILQ